MVLSACCSSRGLCRTAALLGKRITMSKHLTLTFSPSSALAPPATPAVQRRSPPISQVTCQLLKGFDIPDRVAKTHDCLPYDCIGKSKRTNAPPVLIPCVHAFQLQDTERAPGGGVTHLAYRFYPTFQNLSSKSLRRVEEVSVGQIISKARIARVMATNSVRRAWASSSSRSSSVVFCRKNG